MKKLLDNRTTRTLAVYVGIGTPYFFLLDKLGVDFTSWSSSLIMIVLYACIDLARWGLKETK